MVEAFMIADLQFQMGMHAVMFIDGNLWTN